MVYILEIISLADFRHLGLLWDAGTGVVLEIRPPFKTPHPKSAPSSPFKNAPPEFQPH